MKIDSTNSIPAGGVRGPEPKAADPARGAATPASGQQPAGGPGAAQVELSARAKELRATLDAAKQAPDVREDVVNDVRQRIADGRYRIDPQQIASRLIDRKA